jgi:hypothetical protein
VNPPDPSSLEKGRMARRGCLPSLLMGSLAVVALLVALVAAMNAVGCCAIDCERFPEKCAENQRRKEKASLVLVAALVVAGGSVAGAVCPRRRR